MNAQLQDYRTQIHELPECADSWFPEALTRYRAGDEEARRQILGSCLRVALQLAEERRGPDSTDDVFDLIEEANRGVTQALRTFSGTSAEDFLRHVTDTVNARLDRHPDKP